MRISKVIIGLLIACFVISCEDVIDVDLDTAAPRLVIDASIDWVKNTDGNQQKIVLSTTTAYYSDEFPPVSGASIIVENMQGTIFEFVEGEVLGEYVCHNFVPVIGESYTLKIMVDGEIYEATETLMSVPTIEDTIDQNNTGGFGGDEVEITYYYQDDATEENYYVFKIIEDNVAFPQYSVEDDENSQGNMTPVYYSHKDLEPGDEIDITLYGVSKRYYEYFNKILLASGNDDRPFPTTPTAVRGNIINSSNPDNFAFGYFRLSEVALKTYTIE